MYNSQIFFESETLARKAHSLLKNTGYRPDIKKSYAPQGCVYIVSSMCDSEKAAKILSQNGISYSHIDTTG